MEERRRLATNMANKSKEVNYHLSTSPSQGREKDEIKNKTDNYKTCVGGHLIQ